MILVDSSVLLDIFTQDPVWFGWSAARIMALGSTDVLAINPIVFGEVSGMFATVQDVDYRLLNYRRLPLPWEAAFYATKAFLKYKQTSGKGKKGRTLPDFFIGAHAYTSGIPLLTRDPARVKTYFPSVRLIKP